MMEYGIALTAGTFDPVTKGHLDIIRRAADMCAVLIIGIFENPDKKPLFSLEKRFEALCAATMDIDNAIVITNDGMLFEYAKEARVDVIIKGVRDENDLAYEQKQADFNFEHSGIKTVFLEADPKYKNVSSTLVRKLISEGKDVSRYVPKEAISVFKG
ncbi:MAG: pantetheine-phosphate adenylyltransferase [Eubacteriales bacterium]|nr:pantetheine-phosphate adenylyltransferase [Eubacteriales bacterium]